jgi:hypothetical protein
MTDISILLQIRYNRRKRNDWQSGRLEKSLSNKGEV